MLKQNIKSSKMYNIDNEIALFIEKEKKRLNEGLELIPSENFVSKAVLEALGSTLTNKYSEGYPKKRYYGGNEVIDEIESIAINRAKELFNAEHVNIQPYSGSGANLACYFALLKFGETILGMNLAHGGHLTHGHKVNFSGKAYNFESYGVDIKTGYLDYDNIRRIAKETKPKMIVSGATAYPRKIDFSVFHEIAEEVGAISLADISHIAGLILGDVHPSPFPFTDIVMTTTHKTLRGPRGAMILCKNKFAKEIDSAVFPGMQGGPHNHTNAAKAVMLKEASTEEFKDYTKQIVINAKALANSLMDNGLNLVSGGTDNHLILVDLQNINITGQVAETLLDKVNITCNKNMIPGDPRSPFDPSGIRIGTPALTTRGMKTSEMIFIGELIAKAINQRNNPSIIESILSDVKGLCNNFKLYSEE